MTIEIATLLVFGLVVLTCSFFSLRSLAISERDAVRRSYEEDVVTTTRLIMRLKSFTTTKEPLQDNRLSLVTDIKGLIEKNSDLPLPKSFDKIASRLEEQNLRTAFALISSRVENVIERP